MKQDLTTTGVIVAGGKGRRMGGKDKGLLDFDGRPLIQHVISTIKPQVSKLVINANRNLDEYAKFGYPVISDELGDFQGPLAGFLAVMQQLSTTHMLTVPCDCPHMPNDLVSRLREELQRADAEIAVAHDGQRMQPIHALISVGLQASLQAYLQSGERKIDWWYAKHKLVEVDFSDVAEAFLNINTPEEREMQQNRRRE